MGQIFRISKSVEVVREIGCFLMDWAMNEIELCEHNIVHKELFEDVFHDKIM